MAKKTKSRKVLSEKELAKKYRRSGTAEDIVIDTDKMPWLPSRFLALNDMLGGGIPYGKILELFGEESSGKSLLAFDFAYCAQALGGHVLWVDAEFSYTKNWAKQNGLDSKRVTILPDTAIETISDWCIDMGLYWRNKLPNNEPILIVLDSLAAVDTLTNKGVEQSSKKAEMGNRAKAIGDFLRFRHPVFEDLGICFIAINQLRKKIGASNFEDPNTTPGGQATKFFASQRVGVYGGKQVKEKIKGREHRVGRLSSIRLVKNKVAPPKPTIKAAPVYFDEQSKHDIGFDKYFNFDEVLLRMGVVDKASGSSSYKIKGKTIAVGKEKFMKLIEKDDKLRRKLIRKSGINTISKTQRLLDSLTTNLYDVDKVNLD